ncbi:MAG: hypothetical protein NVSMB18_10720 [Acetobacteraceae bacterium]
MRLSSSMKYLAVGIIIAAAAPSKAAVVDVKVTFNNLLPTNSDSFAPLRFGFNRGVFDAFNNKQVATAPIITIAEGGSGSAWFPAFAAADPTATLGSVSTGPALPGAQFSTTLRVDTARNPFFTYAAMVVPSNDHFIGNDDPMAYRLLDANGNLLINSITDTAADIWDNGSEAFSRLTPNEPISRISFAVSPVPGPDGTVLIPAALIGLAALRRRARAG